MDMQWVLVWRVRCHEVRKVSWGQTTLRNRFYGTKESVDATVLKQYH
jgi:hypothetical protein